MARQIQSKAMGNYSSEKCLYEENNVNRRERTKPTIGQEKVKKNIYLYLLK